MNNLKNNLVVQHNELIVASYEMTVHEQNVLLACISQLDSRPEAKPITDQDTYTITVEQAKDLFYDKKSERNAYRDLEFASRNLFERKVELDLGNNETLLTRFVQSIKFKPNDGCVELRFATEILPYLTQLHGNYTQYRMGQVVQLTSIHSRRLFELILMWSGQQQWQQELEMDDFRDLMNVYGKYKQFGQLKDRVIDPAVAMVNENSDFHVTVGYRKVMRSFKFIQLKYHRKQAQKAPPQVDDKRDANTPDMFHGQTDNELKGWQKKGLSDKQINKIAVNLREFVDCNIAMLTAGGAGKNDDYNPIFESWKPLLKDPKQVNRFVKIHDFLAR